MFAFLDDHGDIFELFVIPLWAFVGAAIWEGLLVCVCGVVFGVVESSACLVVLWLMYFLAMVVTIFSVFR